VYTLPAQQINSCLAGALTKLQAVARIQQERPHVDRQLGNCL
jgi:hypothetical protein